MRACPERQMAVALARGIEAARIGELGRIVVGGDIVDHQPVTLGDFLSADLGIFCCRAHEILHRAGPANRFLDDARKQRTIGLDPRELLRIAGQRQHRACSGRRSGIMSGSGEDDVIARKMPVGEIFAVNLRIGDDAGDIFSRFSPALRRQPRKIGLEIGHCARHELGDRLGRQVLDARLVEVFILAAEHLLGQHQHPRFVLFGHAQDLHHHVERVGGGDQLDEIRFGPCRYQPLNRVLRQGADIGLNPHQVLGHEPFLGQLAVFHVDRGIEHHQ